MGPPEAAGARPNLIPVDNASDGFTAVMSGLSALLPPGAWAMAAEMLTKFGFDDSWVAFKLDQAGRPA